MATTTTTEALLPPDPPQLQLLGLQNVRKRLEGKSEEHTRETTLLCK
jgi:hypothetical protein